MKSVSSDYFQFATDDPEQARNQQIKPVEQAVQKLHVLDSMGHSEMWANAKRPNIITKGAPELKNEKASLKCEASKTIIQL
ncbi:hypothetical protein [Pseudomonas protegens]|uniref:hypothetical protein n=1 Tax=Pseudomonas protegens TaxID=380021 RepID=UPI00227F78D0|nr:hypothetical protein [Pseudomonas protegens]MCY7264282.1 hypothetical protein [Pseudomonas protegens]